MPVEYYLNFSPSRNKVYVTIIIIIIILTVISNISYLYFISIVVNLEKLKKCLKSFNRSPDTCKTKMSSDACTCVCH